MLKTQSYNSFSKKVTEQLFVDEFKQLLKLFVFSYDKMISGEIFDLKELENFLRNIFIEKYLIKYKSQFLVDHLNFYAEVAEINKSYESAGFIDIHISNPLKIMGREKLFYAFECKRLDGYSGKNEAYIKDGILRFVSAKYSSEMPLGGMIGFVQGFKKNSDMSELISDIKNTLSGNKQIKSIKNLTFYQIDKNFKHSYFSRHKRIGKMPEIDLYSGIT